jgi:5-oxopent-3-ene-1,2,5-tricarboxylate decarboxylase / 2-hydroxyhepta-2,4-diene-1,7-dioate isomerase
MDIPPFELSGTVYGTLLNHRSALDSLGDGVNAPPYAAAPKAPVLYVKPRNTLAQSGEPVLLSAAIDAVEVGACLGVVFSRTACHVSEGSAFDYVAGYAAVNDVSIPHTNYYRPSVRYKACDRFCPIGAVTSRAAAGNPDVLTIRTVVDGTLVQSASTADLVRSVARLIADVTDFMTLSPGDVLAVGASAPAPRVYPGQTVTIEIDTLEALTNRFVRAET